MESRFVNTRRQTVALCNPLEIEDYVVQPHADISPPKWHLGHTTWFLEELILNKYVPQYRFYNQEYKKIFNSYYKGLGEHWVQRERGVLSRPLVKEILAYRKNIDDQLKNLIQKKPEDENLKKIIELGMNHEEQHQELLLMDIKFILATNAVDVKYSPRPLPDFTDTSKVNLQAKKSWCTHHAGVYDVGAVEENFAYDNEGPRHKKYLEAFRICEQLVTNGEYLAFMEDKGYQRPELWLSMGLDWVKNNKISAPLYWKFKDNEWWEFSLHGKQKINLNHPVSHISYFEAEAFARWSKKRLPTEEEFEIAQKDCHQTGNRFHASSSSTFTSELWCWTKSHYSPYPGFKTFEGEIAEYNGKFMCNQFVLKGGCFATPKGHYRKSYRNFYEPSQRWMFSGISLAEDAR